MPMRRSRVRVRQVQSGLWDGIPDIHQLLEHKLGGGLQYACSHWNRHLRLSPISNTSYIYQVIPLAGDVLENAPPWIEVMSLENQLEEVIYSMYGLLDWFEIVSSSLLLQNVGLVY